jgi:hypothetical protein
MAADLAFVMGHATQVDFQARLLSPVLWFARQQPPGLSRLTGHSVMAHRLLRSPTAGAVILPISAPPLLPPAFSHSSITTEPYST